MKVTGRMLRHYFADKTKRTQQVTMLVVVLIVAGIGTYLLSSSHAASPYSLSSADSGALSGEASEQGCTASSDSNCVAFGAATSASCTTTLNAPAAGSTTDVIGPAVEDAKSGDTICLNSGNYAAFSIIRTHDTSYVTIQPAPGASPVLAGQGTVSNSSFIRFQDLTITAQINVQDGNPTEYGNGGPSSNIQFINNNISGDSGPRIDSFSGSYIISNLLFQGNYIHDIEAPGVSYDSTTQTCVGSAGTDGQGITLSGADNVQILDNTFQAIAWHYIQGGGGTVGITVDHNLFTGPQPANTVNCAHLNVWQIWDGGNNDTFSNNVVIGSAATGTTPVAGNSLMFENGPGGADCSVVMSNTTVTNNLFVDQNGSFEWQIGNTNGLKVTNNTVVGSSYGTLTDSSCHIDPPSGLTATASSGGTLAVGTYKYEVTGVTSGGAESTVPATDPEVTATTSSGNQTVNLTWTTSAGASSYKIYRTAVNGATDTETYLATVSGLTYTDDGSTALGSATPPTTAGTTPGTNATLTNNIVTNNSDGSLNFVFGGCTGTCTTDYNVSEDKTAGPYEGHYGSAYGDLPDTTHYVTSWTPTWQTTTWNLPSTFAPGTSYNPPAGYYQPPTTGSGSLPFQAGYQGNIGP